ncbi:SGNH/GDSL hydrolase family protein [Thermomonospora umbrina]|uniref:Lysophospholipase L1-like esterase n=1 Tax=Thermomonospora umbrina TaxID=111806 RepID=A0A3D9SVQ9_9ACTN|nr:SGNH/GDSL hydrolase family protein [Thermomonospora umbrina]REE99898.1 lysophospholipase L1-like esterase [Thermomonospora umbrina]
MRLKSRPRAALVALILTLCLGGGPAHADAPPTYYLALGDSGAVGAQVGQGPTDEGYTDVLHAALKADHPDLRLVKLGCGGETTTTMIKGGICSYDAGSQLNAAVDFLERHPGRVEFVTLSIGVNNVGCLLQGDVVCGLRGTGTLVAELPQIIAKLRAAGGDTPVYASATSYDPGLASWVKGDKATAVASVPLVDAFNAVQRAAALVGGFKVADVGGAFATHDFSTTVTMAPYGTIPLNVARICAWTSQCTHGDGHANAEGYRQMAGAFLRVVS